MIDAKSHSPKVLIVGCGDIGIATAAMLQAQAYHVIGARRSVNKLPADLPAIAIDVTQPDTLSVLASHDWAAVIVTLTADQFTEQGYQASYVNGLKNILAVLSQDSKRLPLILFASSTSVYGQNDGSIVDEHSVTEPSGFSGEAMLRAEALLSAYPGQTCAIRFGGIYGRGLGRMVKRLADGFICPREPVIYSNRIHFEDCCRVFVHLIEAFSKSTVSDNKLAARYLAVDSQPSRQRDIMEWLAKEQGIDIDKLQEGEATSRGGNKRCNNAELLATGFDFKYPNYQAGFAPLLE